MPRRFVVYSRKEPARTILFVVSLLTLVMQAMALALHFGAFAVLNFAVVAAICGWGVWSSHRSNLAQMPTAAFWLALIWMWSGLTRAILSPDWMLLLWFPMLVVAMVMAVTYINLSHQKKMGYR